EESVDHDALGIQYCPFGGVKVCVFQRRQFVNEYAVCLRFKMEPDVSQFDIVLLQRQFDELYIVIEPKHEIAGGNLEHFVVNRTGFVADFQNVAAAVIVLCKRQVPRQK